MFAKLGITVSTSSNVEISLHLVQVQAAVDATAITAGTPPHPGRLAPLGLLLSERDNVVYVLLTKALVVEAGAGDDLAVRILAQLVYALVVDPLRPIGGVLLQPRGSEDAVAGGVLYVDVNVLALHFHDNVNVDLHVVADALLDGVGVVLDAAPPLAYG